MCVIYIIIVSVVCRHEFITAGGRRTASISIHFKFLATSLIYKAQPETPRSCLPFRELTARSRRAERTEKKKKKECLFVLFLSTLVFILFIYLFTIIFKSFLLGSGHPPAPPTPSPAFLPMHAPLALVLIQAQKHQIDSLQGGHPGAEDSRNK